MSRVQIQGPRSSSTLGWWGWPRKFRGPPGLSHQDRPIPVWSSGLHPLCSPSRSLAHEGSAALMDFRGSMGSGKSPWVLPRPPGAWPSTARVQPLRGKEQDTGTSSGARGPVHPHPGLHCRSGTSQLVGPAEGGRSPPPVGCAGGSGSGGGACPRRFLGPARSVFFLAGGAFFSSAWFHGRSTTSCSSPSPLPGVTSLCGAHRSNGSSSPRRTRST